MFGFAISILGAHLLPQRRTIYTLHQRIMPLQATLQNSCSRVSSPALLTEAQQPLRAAGPGLGPLGGRERKAPWLRKKGLRPWTAVPHADDSEQATISRDSLITGLSSSGTPSRVVCEIRAEAPAGCREQS